MAQKLADQIAGIQPLAAADVSPEGIGLVVVINQGGVLLALELDHAPNSKGMETRNPRCTK
jgi:hypothetical protein